MVSALFRSGVCVTRSGSQNHAHSKMNVTYLLTYYLLTPWSTVLFDKLIGNKCLLCTNVYTN